MTLQVREYATLSVGSGRQRDLDHGEVSQATFDWLLELHQRWNGKAKLLSVEGKQRLKLANYVGYLQSPAGEGIEILPKTELTAPSDPAPLRALLQRMLRSSPTLKHREASQAPLIASQQPLHQWVIGQFLRELTELTRRGLRFDYLNTEDECHYLRGQLDINRQLRQTPDKATRFHVRYAEFSPQRLENRLLRSALDAAAKHCQDSGNWRLANTLRLQLEDIEPHPQPLRDLPRWDTGKQLTAYRAVKPWCQLILESLNPNFQQGQRQGIALLFPMERLYEQYLEHCLRKQLQADYALKAQASSQYLLTHCPIGSQQSQRWFQLKPDFLIQQNNRTHCVLDAKWKLLDASKDTGQDKYNIKQADLYQMLAYGQQYLDGHGDMYLIYSSHTDFHQPLPVFEYSDRLRLWCVPFDLQSGTVKFGDDCALSRGIENEQMPRTAPKAALDYPLGSANFKR